MGKVKHGWCGTRLYNIWKDMRRRCNNPNRAQYHNYGGRGIKVCEEWNESFEPFRDWALQNGYQEDLSVDRKNNDGNYEPSNCKWSTDAEQSLNTRQNARVEIDGVTKTVTEWAKENGLNVRSTLWRYEQGARGHDLIAPLKVTMTGKHHSEETKERISAKLKGVNAPWFGKVRPAETRKKMSEGMKGRKANNKIIIEPDKLNKILHELKSETVKFVAIKYGYSWDKINRVKKEYIKG